MIATEGMEVAGSRTFLRVDCWPATSLTKPIVMDTVQTAIQATRARFQVTQNLY